MTTYTGDILLAVIDETGGLDWLFDLGQPNMTNGLETISLLYVFGEDSYINAIVDSESQKMQSEFPEVIRRNVVSDEVKNDGTVAIQKALKPMTDEQIATRITVTGEILSTSAIGWLIDIEAADKSIRYFINWEEGVLTAQFSKAA